jgi:hypothetical protein
MQDREYFLKKFASQPYATMFKSKFYDKYSKIPGMYMFIVTNNQLPHFLADVASVGMTKNLIKQVKPAINSNYPENGYNLNMFIYEFKKDDHV